ncbi:2-hydroxyacyl-CoA lyase [Arachis hypogaea]|nr:2-hydroxyacyl-CoA lyase [Arachis hypogaea]
MEAQIAKDVVPFNFLTPTRIIRDVILGVGSPAPVVVSEGANTMDIPVSQLPVVVIIFNHGGVYGGDRRTFKELNGPHKNDPAPTSFISKEGYSFWWTILLGHLMNSSLLFIVDPMLVQKVGVGGCNTRTDL